MRHSVQARVRVEKDTVTRITRNLKGKGSFKIQIGQQVSPEEIIGSATASAGFRTLNLSKLLSVAPIDVEKLLVRKVGQKIYRGELLASKKGWLGNKKLVTSPSDGVLDFLNIQTGELKIAFLPKKADLPAGVYGFVETIDKERGQAVIRTLVSMIYGVLGSGRSREGILRILSKKDDLISKDRIRSSHQGCILAGGSLFFKDAVSAVISTGVSGIITGGIKARDYRSMAGGHLIFPKKMDNDIGVSVVVCEGFGTAPMGDDIFEILSEYEGKFIFIDGNKAVVCLPSSLSSSLMKVKNTRLPDLKSDYRELLPERTESMVELNIGAKVRIIGNSYFGEQGKLLAINDTVTFLPSGIRAYLATIETARRKIQVPVANLEIIM